MLKTSLLTTAILLSATAFANNAVISNEEQRENIAITIYNDSLALVNETRTIPLAKGINNVELRGVSAQIRAETALIKSLSQMPFQIIEQNFDYDLLTPSALLEKAVGQEIEIVFRDPETQKETIETATLLAYNNGQPVLKFKDRIQYGGLGGEFAFKNLPEGLRDRPTLSVKLLNEAASNNPVQLTYLTSGFGWAADYNAKLSDDEKQMDIAGLVTLNNHSGTAFKNVNLQLIAGSINLAPSNDFKPKSEVTLALGKQSNPYAEKLNQEVFGDYHLYKIPFKVDLNNNQTKQVSLLNAQSVPVEKQYLFDLYFERSTNDGDNIKATVNFKLKNDKESNLGMPLPKGTFRIYQNDQSGNALLVGEDSINHIAENEEFNITTGNAFDISLTKKTIGSLKIYKNVYKNEVIFNNAKDETVIVDYISRIPSGTWKILNTSHNYETPRNDRALWKVEIPAKGKTTLTYEIQVVDN